MQKSSVEAKQKAELLAKYAAQRNEEIAGIETRLSDVRSRKEDFEKYAEQARIARTSTEENVAAYELNTRNARLDFWQKQNQAMNDRQVLADFQSELEGNEKIDFEGVRAELADAMKSISDFVSDINEDERSPEEIAADLGERRRVLEVRRRKLALANESLVKDYSSLTQMITSSQNGFSSRGFGFEEGNSRNAVVIDIRNIARQIKANTD